MSLVLLGDDGINFLNTVKRHPTTSISEMWDLLSRIEHRKGWLVGFYGLIASTSVFSKDKILSAVLPISF
ncbi:hypothetical protein ND16A_1671 [Thalassotalea sp. ND16A]|nr:hypothetical protein ND16A_1671 [Thalassotalea sp. ND16A]